jgi:hypothetical protein
MSDFKEQLVFKSITESDDFSAIVDKFNYNFDIVKAFGGGDRGKIGNEGKRGLPGSTGIGKKGETGIKGATIQFIQFSLSDGDLVNDPLHREGDIIVDSGGNFFSVISNNVGTLVYRFDYAITSAITGSLVVTERQIFDEGTNTIIKWYLRDTGNDKDRNAVFADRIVGATTDEVDR